MSSATDPRLSPADFSTAEDSIQHALEAIRRHLGMAVAYVSEFQGDMSVFRNVDAPGLEAMVKPGDERHLDTVFCRHILAGRLPELMPDAGAIPFAQTVPILQQLPIGAHMSVPIRLPGGQVYGMFCCLSFEPDRSLTDRDLNVMKVFAEMAGRQIARDIETKVSLAARRAGIAEVIEQGLFRVVAQPIFHLQDRVPLGFEILCRFAPTPYRSPDLWFKEADSVGLGVPLEIAVLREAFRAASALPHDCYLSVNASPDLLLSGELPRLIAEAKGRDVLVEVTEHAAVSDYAAMRDALAALRRAGARIAVDDAGAGYSGLQHIIEVQPDVLKLDMGLVRNIETDPACRALISALIFFARETGCDIIAEGVETEGQVDILTELGVHKAQGYVFSRPIPLADAARIWSTSPAPLVA
jgi:EAL domain-containing protein (putative c-di-GMP-specific phosphodiesterase class I)